MKKQLLKILRAVYLRLPLTIRPVSRDAFYWSLGKRRLFLTRSQRAFHSTYQSIPVGLRSPLEDALPRHLMRCRSLIVHGRIFRGRRVEFLDFDVAHLESYEFRGPGSREVLVESSCSLLNPGTERAILCGFPGIRQAFPYRPGSSAAGTIITVGRHVREFSPGDRVAGILHHASHQTVMADLLLKMPDGVSYAEASFINLGVTVLQGIRKARIGPGDRVAIIGQGLIGQLSNRLARVAGASTVIAIAAGASREKVALLPGGAHEFIALSEGTSRLRDIQADVVIEAAGTVQATTTALQCARDGGRIVILGSVRGLGREVDLRSLLQDRGLTLVGAHSSTKPEKDASRTRWTHRQEATLFLELLQMGRLKVADLVTWHARPDECNAVYEALANDHRGQVGILFNWKPRSGL